MIDILLDFLPTLLLFAAIALLLYLGYRYLKSGRRKGKVGERKVKRALTRAMVPGDKLINDLYLVNPHTDAPTQIDHILISTRGLFVVETKNLSGDFSGNDYDDDWTPILRNGNYGTPLHSPVRQNLGHIKTVKAVAETNIFAENIVVFVQGVPAHVHSKAVYSLKGLNNHLRACKGQQLSPAERDRIYEKLYYYKEHPPVTAHQHRRYIKRNYR